MMMSIKRAAIGLLSMALCASAIASVNVSKSESILYVVRAKQAQVIKQGDQYQLVMQNPHVSFFANRPVRLAGHVPVKHFLKTWSEGSGSFAKDNPNAALLSEVKNSSSKKDIERFVTLSNPTLQANSSRMVINIARLNQKDKALKPMQLANAALFIDDGCNLANPPPNGCW